MTEKNHPRQKHSLRKVQPQVLRRINYVYNAQQGGNIEVPEESVAGKDYFAVYFDSRGQEVRREDYERGKLKKIIISEYDSDGRLKYQEVYSALRKFFRRRNQQGTLEEFADDGRMIRVLRED